MIARALPPPSAPLVIGWGAVFVAAPSYPAFWGFLGALIYGLAQVVATCATEGALTRRAQVLGWSRLLISLLFGVFGAQAFMAAAIRMTKGGLDLPSASFAVGLLGSGVWPAIEKALKAKAPALVSGFGAGFAAFTKELGSKPSGGATE